MSDIDHRSLLETLGGEAGCKRLSQEFYARVAASKELKNLFPGKSLRCATEEFAAFLIQFLDGDPDQTQYRWWLSLHESHARFQITKTQRSAWLALMDEALAAQIEDAKTRLALSNFFRVSSAYIVGQQGGTLDHEELIQRWRGQLELDQVIDHLANTRDAEAMALAGQFASRPAVFVGLLARMMEAAREPLIEFVLASVQNDNGLAAGRFNGRTLLHFAAGSACLALVTLLLEMGVDPDILDGGWHTPLYRTAATRNGEVGALIVTALVRAGATVDHCGGVNKSTALHEAARHGNLRVAEALLAVGANRAAKDKKGLTPMDRARNCRRHEVAKLLASS